MSRELPTKEDLESLARLMEESPTPKPEAMYCVKCDQIIPLDEDLDCDQCGLHFGKDK